MDASPTENHSGGVLPLACFRRPDRGPHGGYPGQRHRNAGPGQNSDAGPCRHQRDDLDQRQRDGLEQSLADGSEQRQLACPRRRRFDGSVERPRVGPGQRQSADPGRCLIADPGWLPCGRPAGHRGMRSGRDRRCRSCSLSRATSAGFRRLLLGPWASRVPQPRLSASSFNTTQTSEEGRSTITGATLFKHVRRRPTLPRGPPRSTIGAEGLNFRVRNGTGCFPFAITAETLLRCHRPEGLLATVSREPHSGRKIKWSRSQATRPISTGQLHTLPCFHLRPINPVV